MGEFETVCIRIAVQANVADILLDHPDGLPIAKLAAKTGLDEGKLGRILRCLATRNCFRESKSGHDFVMYLLIHSE
jgi:hypothetical protein